MQVVTECWNSVAVHYCRRGSNADKTRCASPPVARRCLDSAQGLTTIIAFSALAGARYAAFPIVMRGIDKPPRWLQ